MWNNKTGFPSTDYFAAVHPMLADVATKRMSGSLFAPGKRAGRLTNRAARLLGLEEASQSPPRLSTHTRVFLARESPRQTMVLVIGTSACHMLNSKIEKIVPGVAGVVEGRNPPRLLRLRNRPGQRRRRLRLARPELQSLSR
jgi:L-ribulokinase